MRVFMLIVFVISSLVLGQELLTGEAYTRTGSGKFDDEPVSYLLKVLFHGLIWLSSLIVLFLPKKHLNKLNDWLRTLEPKDKDKQDE